VPNDYTLASVLDRQFGDLPVGLRKIFLSMIHGFAGNPRGQLHLHYLEAARMKSSRCPLVACSDVMGSSVTDILGAAVALAPAVIGAAIGSQIRETGPNRRRAKQLFAIHPPSPGGGECRMHRTRFEKRKRKNPEEISPGLLFLSLFFPCASHRAQRKTTEIER
jgi:hypothetical protein